jgi:hypothetical protein
MKTKISDGGRSMERNCRWIPTLFILLLIGCLGFLPSPAAARPQTPSAPTGASQDGVIGFHTTFRTYSCGAGYTFFQFQISTNGALSGLAGPAGFEHLNVGTHRFGYEVCYTHPTFGFFNAFELEDSGSSNLGAPFVALGCAGSNFPCEIDRFTSDGLVRIKRRFTGNSFVGPVTAGNATYDNVNFNGVGCDSLGECGNCTNRTAHVVTRVTNLTGSTLTGVAYQEILDLDISATTGDDFFVRAEDSVSAYDGGVGEDDRQAVLMQSLIIDPLTDAYGLFGTPLACDATFGVATPTGLGDFEGRVLQFFGSVGPFSNTGNNFRLHVRKF